MEPAAAEGGGAGPGFRERPGEPVALGARFGVGQGGELLGAPMPGPQLRHRPGRDGPHPFVGIGRISGDFRRFSTKGGLTVAITRHSFVARITLRGVRPPADRAPALPPSPREAA